uniref:Exocyst complex component Sec3 PIP2-binding N-terminal domain-containing protein n=1 Tax=Ananas comosus var. bracteatus TaxID=296719 RepID=A0A6V7Q2R0_ANACO|nr:unnamed protein product [Ananas comosus var. bracteatus]
MARSSADDASCGGRARRRSTGAGGSRRWCCASASPRAAASGARPASSAATRWPSQSPRPHQGILEPAKIYKPKHLSKVEVIQNDPSGCTFMLGFDNLRMQSVAPPQWTMRNKDDRNRILMCILNMCKEILGGTPKVIGIDIVEMALWAKENTPAKTSQVATKDGPATSVMTENDSQVTVERDLVSQAEEEDMEALLGTYVMGIGEAEAFSERLKRELLALEAANVHALLESEPIVEEVFQGLEAASICVEDMDEWLGIFNVKLRHMREDIESIESRNNKLELQSVSNKVLIEELDKLLERLQIPSEFEAALTGGSFDEANMIKNIEACEWLTSAIKNIEVPNLEPCYAKLRAVKEKRAEFVLLKCTFVRRASEFLRNYFPSLIDFMINDKSYFSQRGQLKRPDHADLRYKCRIYARLLQHIKAREFSNERRATTKVSKSSTVWLEGPPGSSQTTNSADSFSTSEAYSKMLTVFIPLLVDESSFFAHFMCFEVSALAPSDSFGSNKSGSDGTETNLAAQTGSAVKRSNILAYVVKTNFDTMPFLLHFVPLPSTQKADVAGFVRVLLDDLETRISMLFSRFVDDACYQIEKYEKNVRQMGVLPYIPRFATLATRMEQYIQGQSRDLVDQAYTKIVSIMFVTLERVAQVEPKYADIVLLENYAAFQHSLYDLANVVPTLAKFYHQASESYEQACLCHINMVIYIHFEKLFQFARRIEELMFTNAPEEIPFQIGMSKMELRKTLKSSLSGLDKTVSAMYRKLQKNLTAEELLPSLWEKCKKEFLDKYGSFLKLVAKIYPNETVPSVAEIRELLSTM